METIDTSDITRSANAKTPTIRDVAAQAGVSITTVSHFLNARFDQMSVDTRHVIAKVVDELGFRPNRVAASLKTRRTTTLGVVVSNILNPFFAGIVQRIEHMAHQSGYNVILCSTADEPANERRYLEVLHDRQVDGLILATAGGTGGLIESLVSTGMPVVLIDRALPDLPVDSVSLDNTTAVRQAVDYLCSLGHRRIAFITGHADLSPRIERLHAFQQAVNARGLELRPDWIVKEAPYKSGGHAAALQLLQPPKLRPTAVISSINVMTLGLLEAIRSMELRYPGEISVLGFDEVEWATVVLPSLTVIAQPLEEMADAALACLIRRLEGDASAPVNLRFPPQLLVRHSCAVPPS